ncbi:MAG: NUDIX domain-containing protein [Spirochaetales bacterium]
MVRVSSRAIIIKDNKLVLMFRNRHGKIYYVTPGGGVNDGETPKQCVIREVEEEFGIIAKPLKKLYIYKDAGTTQHYYLCEWIGGQFATGKGEEFENNDPENIFIPKLVPIEELKNLPLVPPEIKNKLIEDLKNGFENKTITIKGLYEGKWK